MPITQKFHCPKCGVLMKRRPGGRCPECGEDVRVHVMAERDREETVEKVVAVIGTILLLGLSLFAGGCSVVEGIVVYAVAGFAVWYWGRATFDRNSN